MAFLDELKDRAMDLGRAGVAKSKQLGDLRKLLGLGQDRKSVV